jgi:3'(2'), 5'-bisphosphate nucleotidase
LSALLDQLIDASIAAADTIMDVYSRPINAMHKSDGSPVTEADERAEVLILEHLAHTGIPVLAEESVAAGRIPALDGRFFVVDPLDGTKEFLKRNGEFTVNIALVEHGEPVLGVVHAPAREVMYAATRGAGAFRRDADGSRKALHVQANAPPTLRVLGSRSHGDAVLDRLIDSVGKHERISVGSALKFGLLAEGSADLYVRRGPTSEWDTAAGHAVVLEAGGSVVDMAGAPLRYNARDTLRNPSFMAYADRSRDWVALLSST